MASGSFYINRTSGSTYLSFRVDWSSASNGSAANSSDMDVSVWVIKSNSSTARTYGSADTTVTVGSTSLSQNGLSFSVSPGTSVLLFSKKFTGITHNNDGSKTVKISVSVGGNVMGASGSSNAILDNIPRQATLKDAPDFTDEENPTITFSNPAGTAVDKLEVCISSDGYLTEVPYKEITDKTSTSYTFKLTPEEVKALQDITVSGSTSRIVYFYIKTTIAGVEYRDNLKRTFKVVNCMPTLDPIVTDTNERARVLVGDDPNKIIKGFNLIGFRSGATAYKGASIIKESVTCGNTVKTTSIGYFTNAESDTFMFSATDNRGQTISKPVSKEIIDYIKLTCNLNVSAPDADGDLEFSISGNFFDGNFGAVDNSLTVEYRYRKNDEDYPTNDNGDDIWINATTNITDAKYKAVINLSGLDYQSSYTFQARAADAVYYEYIYTNEYTVKTTPVFDWSDKDFNFNVPVHVKGALTNDIPIVHTDVDTMLTSGRYYLGVGATNRPVNKNGWLDVQNYGDGNYCYQKFITYTGEKYERWRQEGAWSTWSSSETITSIQEFGFGGISGYAKFTRNGNVTCLTLYAGSITSYKSEQSGLLLVIPEDFTPASSQVTGDRTTHALWSRGSHRPSIVGGLSIFDASRIRIFYDFTSSMGANWTIGASMTWIN